VEIAGALDTSLVESSISPLIFQPRPRPSLPRRVIVDTIVESATRSGKPLDEVTLSIEVISEKGLF